MRPTGVIFFPAFDWAISPTHPEREERLLYTRDQIFEEGLLDLPGIKEFSPRLATFLDVARVHFCVPHVRDQVRDAHLVAAGACLVLADCIMSGEVRNAFALVRPPGHHAMRVVHGNRGFCNINNEAIAIEYLRRRYGVGRIAVVDSDVHHGDGTQDIFYHDPDVLCISFHQDGRTLYPGTGFTNELGGPGAYLRTINIPLPPGTTDTGLHYVLDNLVLPVLRDFESELIINSAGQDNHYTDPLANMCVTARGYADLTAKLRPHLAVLEGGYAIESALPYVNMAILLALAGYDYSCVREPGYRPGMLRESAEVTAQIQRVVEELRALWENRHRVDPEEVFGKDRFYERQKFVYYDTDDIREFQLERVRRCLNCPGYLTVASSARHPGGRRYQILGITIPVRACEECYGEGYATFEAARRTGDYTHVYLQDKATDVFRAYDTGTKEMLDWEG